MKKKNSKEKNLKSHCHIKKKDRCRLRRPLGTFSRVRVVGFTRKIPQCPESLSYQKKDGRMWPCPPFFWYETDFFYFSFVLFILGIFFFFFFLKSRCHTKRRMGTATHTHPFLAWQRLTTLGTFSRGPVQLQWRWSPHLCKSQKQSLGKVPSTVLLAISSENLKTIKTNVYTDSWSSLNSKEKKNFRHVCNPESGNDLWLPDRDILWFVTWTDFLGMLFWF